MSYMEQNDTRIISDSYGVFVNDKYIPYTGNMCGNNVTNINGHIYIDGRELVDGKWKRTFKALWNLIF